MIINWIKTYSLVLLAILLAVVVGITGVQTLRLAKEKTNFAGYKSEVVLLEAKRERVYSTDLKASRAATDALQNIININQKAKDAEIKLINSRHAVAVAGLRNRPENRSTSVGSSTNLAGATEGATGLQLSGPDGRFLAGEAARADTLRAALQTCYKNYDAALDVLKVYGEGLSK